MNLNNSTRNSCFSAIFDPSDPYENYLDKKACIKAIQMQLKTLASMYELQK